VVFVALAVALLIEQARALPAANPVHGALRRYARAVERALDGGRYQQGVAAWFLVIAPVVLAVAGVRAALERAAPPVALAWDIGVLYLTMGFRQFSYVYTEVLEALRAGDLSRARAATQRWRGSSAGNMSASEIARVAIERGLTGAHRHVFGVIVWFAVFGAAGAVLYRLAAGLRDNWGERSAVDEAQFGRFSREVFGWCDWVPVRLSAVSFAVVGDFEDAIYCWRTQAAAWPDPQQGIVLASGAGAIGVRLGSVLATAEPAEVRPELGTGDDADVELMTSAVGLIWRALVLWMFVIALLTVARWFG
jgi:cobalamin biosynthesis protein CobD/CbiB